MSQKRSHRVVFLLLVGSGLAGALLGTPTSRSAPETAPRVERHYPTLQLGERSAVKGVRRAPGTSRLTGYAAGLQARANLIEAQRTAGTELVP